jgi:hypothetical protein
MNRGRTFATLNTREIGDILTDRWEDRNYIISINQNITILGKDLMNIVGGGLSTGISQEKMARQVR